MHADHRTQRGHRWPHETLARFDSLDASKAELGKLGKLVRGRRRDTRRHGDEAGGMTTEDLFAWIALAGLMAAILILD